MSAKRVITGAQYVQDVRSEFYVSSPSHPLQSQPGNIHLGDTVAVISAVTGNLLAIGEVTAQGTPYDECRTIHITKRFD